MGKIVTLDNLGDKKTKPGITLARLIARAPMYENQIIFTHGFWDLNTRGYGVYLEDLDCMPYWGHAVCTGRNLAAKAALGRDSDYLVFFDDDMTLVNGLADDIEKMIALDKDIVAAIGTTKSVPFWPNIVKVVKLGKSKTASDCYMRKILDWPMDKPFQVDMVGCAFMVIKRKVIEKLAAPWFYMPPSYTENNIVGEDNLFCYNAKMNGFEVWVDPTITMAHIGFYGYCVDRVGPCYLEFKDKVIDDNNMQLAFMKEWKIPNSDHTHILVEEVQAEMRKGLGTPKMFV